jgi:catechol 2,3-dioxygenase-like lactoylglutathione lyase family enzyme
VFHRVTIRVADVGASERFYDAVLQALGMDWRSSEFSIEARDGEHPVTRDLHVGFRAP